MIQCPSCKRILLDSTNGGGYKLRSRMVLFQDEKAYALCPSCKEQVEVPLQLHYGEVSEKKAHVIIKKRTSEV